MSVIAGMPFCASCTQPPAAEAPSHEPTHDEPGVTTVQETPRPHADSGDAFSVAAPSAKEARGLKRLLLAPRGEEVPSFNVQTASGETLDSAALVGKAPFVVVFFTSWCPVCARKMPIVRDALDAAGGKVLTIGVAMDDEDTLENVPAYAKRHGIPFRVVHGQASPSIVEALDPRGSFPVIYVVGKDGIVKDVQIGIKPDHASRLEQALRAALHTPD